MAVVLATLLVPLVVGTASATPPGNRPAVTVTTDTPNGTSVSVMASVNRGIGALASCSYVIDSGAAATCGVDPDSDAKKASHYTIALSDQTDGAHTITVTVRLDDGGKASGSASFTIDSVPRVFAQAWTNVDGIAGFDPAVDVLISELIDTDRSGTVSVGDTIKDYVYPTDLTGTPAFLPFGVSSHAVDLVSVVDPTVIEVGSGSGRFGWAHASTLERYQERIPTNRPSILLDIADTFTDPSGICGDVIRVSTSAPSQPAQGVDDAEDFSADACGDRAVIDVEIDPTN